MPLDSMSRSSVTAASLADVLNAINAADLPAHRAQDLASAVRVVCRHLGHEPKMLPANPRLLAKRLQEIAPEALGFTPARWNNIRSLLVAALRLVGPVSPGRHRQALAPGWKKLWDRLSSRSMRTRLSRFLHFCTFESIAPEEVAPATFLEFRAYIETSLIKHPETAYRDMLSAWEKTRKTDPNWPQVAITVAAPKRNWTRPWTDFPETLRQDIQKWLDRLGGKDPLEELPFRPACESTLQTRERQLREFASAVLLSGRDPASLCELADLVDIETFKSGLRFLLARRNAQSSRTVAAVAMMLKGVARYWVKLDDQHLDRMAALVRRIDDPQHGLTARNRARLRPLADPQKAQALVRLPTRLMQLARREKLPYRASLLAQTAVAIEILLMAPIRLGNLVNLDLEQHIVPVGKGRLHIVIASHEVKNREELEFPLLSPSIKMVERYITKYRPILLRKPSAALFPGRSAGSKSRHVFRQQITKAVFRYTGLEANPHLFRHIAAMLYLQAHPGAYEVVRRLLGHRSMKTTTESYCGLETAAAARHFDEFILKLRGESDR